MGHRLGSKGTRLTSTQEPHLDKRDGFRVALSADFLDEQRRPVFPDLGLSLLENVPGLTYCFLSEYHSEYRPDQLQDSDVLISLKPRVSAKSLEGGNRLCAIGRCGVGYDNVDVAACTERDIAVYVTPPAVTRPVAEAIVLFVLALSHNLLRKDRLVRQGKWAESTRPLGQEPRDRVIGTIGLGGIACEAIRLLKPFGPSAFLAFDPYVNASRSRELNVQLTSLDELLAGSDYVLVNCPLNSETKGLIGDHEFALMKPNAVLINTARGPIVQESALIRALENRQIGGAALDVFEREPVAQDSPLTRMENVILSSHSIAWTEELFRDMGRIDCHGALAIRRGEQPPYVVNPEVLSRPGFQRKLAQYRELARSSTA